MEKDQDLEGQLDRLKSELGGKSGAKAKEGS
jgi:hypothetical protein